MSIERVDLCSWVRILALLLLFVGSFGLNTDGILLLSFKYSVLSDPLSALESWNYDDDSPCSWNGVTCAAPGALGAWARVVALALPNCRLLGSIPANLGMIEHLRNLDLSNNSLNGSLPISLFNASELQTLDLSNNLISGELPVVAGGLKSLVSINLSDNALAGNVPANFSTLQTLTVVSLRNNYFSGSLPSGFNAVEVFDLSSNLINGTLPLDFGGDRLRYLNVSYNRISGKIPVEFARNFLENSTIDLSYNNLTGEIPENKVFLDQATNSFSGNLDLCGKPLKNPCPISSTPSLPPNISEPTSPPAIAAIPRTIGSTPAAISPGSVNEPQGRRANGLRTRTIAEIVVGDLAGIAILTLIIVYVYQLKKKKHITNKASTEKKQANAVSDDWSSSSSESRGITTWSCLRKRGDDEEASETESSATETDGNQLGGEQQQQQKGGSLVTVDGEKALELETLLKASAYILGATGSSIMYKAVLEDGTVLAVRRIGENGLERFKDFENQVRAIAKLVHPNLVRVRGFYWGVDEKLVIYDFVPNGSLANARYRKIGSSPCHLPWEVRLKIAKGMARGLTYLHEKKHVHGNLKPSNILLGLNMEPKIGDFGLERIVSGENSSKVGGSMRNFGSKRSTASRDSFSDLATGPSPSPSPSSIGCASPYQAPESLRSIKPNPKWDVYAFGVVFLELLTGKITILEELGQGTPGLVVEEKNRVLRMVDVAIRADVEGKEDVLLACFKLAFSCLSPVPQKRPSMKEALQVLEKIPSASSPYNCGHC